jgi:hypothetical protein
MRESLGLLCVCGALGWSAGAAAQPADCAHAIELTGDPDLLDAVRSSLSHDAFREGSACRGVALHAARSASGVVVSLRRGDHAVEHVMTDANMLPVWVESWLQPLVEGAIVTVPAASAQVARDTEIPPAHEPPAREPTRAESPPSVPVAFALRLGADLDDNAPWSAAAGLEAAIGFGPVFWLGLAGAGAWSPEQPDTSRLGLRFSGRGGGRIAFDAGVLRIGGGFGVASVSAKRTLTNGEVIRDSEAGVFFELANTLELHVAGPLSISIGANLRLHVPDDIGETPMADDFVDPEPLPVLAGTLEIGIAIDAGGPW